MLLNIKNWHLAENGARVVLNVFGREKKDDKWQNFKIVVPVDPDKDHPTNAYACVRTDKDGKTSCWVKVPVQDTFRKEPKETDDLPF